MSEGINQALQQFIGYSLASRGYDITELVSSMNLKKYEWDYIKKNEDLDLKNHEIEEIEEYFQNKKTDDKKW